MKRLVCVLALAACGGSTPPPSNPEPQPEATQRPQNSGIKIKSELGVINEAQTKSTFSALTPKFDKCEEQGHKRIDVLSGHYKIFARVSEDGEPKYVYFEDSDIGDHETEQCLKDAVMSARFPKPDGGEAEVRYSFELKGSSGRPAVEWSADKVSDAAQEAAKCKDGTSGSFTVTMYVGPHNGKGGKVLAAGVAAPSRDAESKVDCIVKALKDAKVPSPGSWPAKVTFKL
jgi:hypothetical protein